MFDSANKIIANQFAPKIQKMFLKGLANFASSNGVSTERSQLMLKITDLEKGAQAIQYTYCIDWKAVSDTDIRKALDIGDFDILGISSMVPEAVGAVMQENAEKMQCPLPEMLFFLYTIQGDSKIGVAIYHGNAKKRICSIGELFATED